MGFDKITRQRSYLSFLYEGLNYYGIKYEETLIIDWIYTFASSGNMQSMRLYDEKSSCYRTYYWVRYESLICDFNGRLGRKGILNITNTRTLARHITALADAGVFHLKLVNRRVSSDGKCNIGSYSYVAIDEEAYRRLLGREPVFLKNPGKDSPPKESTSDTEIKETPCTPQYKGSEPESTLPLDSAVQPKINIPEDKNSIRPLPSGTEKDTLPPIDNTEVKLCLEKILATLGGYCTERLVEQTVSACVTSGFDSSKDICAYLDYVYSNMSTNSAIRNPKSYFVKAATSCTYGKTFLEAREERMKPFTFVPENMSKDNSGIVLPKEFTKDMADCPVCGESYDRSAGICNNCGLTDPESSEDISLARQTCALDEDKRKALLDALCSHMIATMFTWDKAKAHKDKMEIYRRFGISTE